MSRPEPVAEALPERWSMQERRRADAKASHLPPIMRCCTHTALCERGEVFHLPDATHWVQHDKPDEVNRLMVEFLSG